MTSATHIHSQITAKVSKMDSLEDQLDTLMGLTKLNAEEILSRMRAVDILQSSISEKYPGCTLYTFGSNVTRLGDKESNTDILVDVDGILSCGFSFPQRSQSPFMEPVSKIVEQCTDPRNGQLICQSLTTITKSRVPYLHGEFIIDNRKFNCDLSFSNIMGVKYTELIFLYMQMDPRIRPLLHIVRYFTKFNELTGSKSLKNYGLELLVLVFLAREKIVPTISDLQILYEGVPLVVDGLWNTSFCCDLEKIKKFRQDLSMPMETDNTGLTVLQLAEKFFHEMANFDFKTSAICVLNAEYVLKTSLEIYFKQNISTAPKKRSKENKKPKKVWKGPKERTVAGYPLVIVQDPFDLSSNVGQLVYVGFLSRFVRRCKTTSEAIRNMIQEAQFQSEPIKLMDMFVAPAPKPKPTSKKSRTPKMVTTVSTSAYSTSYSQILLKTDERFLLLSKAISEVVYNDQFETGISFLIGPDFPQIFNEALQNGTIPPNYTDLRNRLWLGFAMEFLQVVWHCFEVELHQDQFKWKNEDNENRLSEEKLEKQMSLWRTQKFNFTSDYVSILENVALILNGDVSIVNRCIAKKTVCDHRDQCKSTEATVSNNPLQHELEITEELSRNYLFKPALIKFIVGYKFDVINNDDSSEPVIHLVLKIVKGKMCHPMFQMIKMIFPPLCSRYATFRLNQLIQG